MRYKIGDRVRILSDKEYEYIYGDLQNEFRKWVYDHHLNNKITTIIDDKAGYFISNDPTHKWYWVDQDFDMWILTSLLELLE